MIVRRTSLLSGKVHEMDLPCSRAQLEAYREGGGLIQNVFPNLSPEQREFLVTGITPEEWEQEFGGEEE